MMGQIGKAAQVSRTNNWARLQARARAFLTLMIALGFALVLIVVILSQHALSGGFYGQNSNARVGVAEPGNEKP
jgi:hypothetical protein